MVTSENYPQRVAFQFLSELQQTFESLHQSKFSSAKEHELTRTSCKLFLELVRKYEHPHQVDKLASVSVQVDQVKGMMQENINTVLSNKENLSHLVHDTQNMAQEASQFQRTAQTTHNNMWWKNMKVLVGIVVLLVVLVAVIAAAFFFNQKQPVV